MKIIDKNMLSERIINEASEYGVNESIKSFNNNPNHEHVISDDSEYKGTIQFFKSLIKISMYKSFSYITYNENEAKKKGYWNYAIYLTDEGKKIIDNIFELHINKSLNQEFSEQSIKYLEDKNVRVIYSIRLTKYLLNKAMDSLLRVDINYINSIYQHHYEENMMCQDCGQCITPVTKPTCEYCLVKQGKIINEL